MLVTVGKFSIRCTQHSIEEIVSRWFGPFGRLMLPAAAAALAAGNNALRTISSSDVKRAPWSSFCSVVLWMECGALASCYKQLGQHSIHLDLDQRILRLWGGRDSSSGEGRSRGWRLPLVRFRSEEARAQWFQTAYGSLDAVAREELGDFEPAVENTAATGLARALEVSGHAAAQPEEGAAVSVSSRRIESRAFRSLGQPQLLWSDSHGIGEGFEHSDTLWGPASGEAVRAIKGVRLSGLRTTVSQPAKNSGSKEQIESQSETDLARKIWNLRTQHLRSAEFSRNLPLSLAIDPDDVLASTFALLEPLPAEILVSRPIFVRFKGQIGSDWGGVRRAWMAKLAAELFDPRLGLVIPCGMLTASRGSSATGTITINPAPDLLYTDQSASAGRTTREEKREEKRESLRAQLDGDHCGGRDRDIERARRREPGAVRSDPVNSVGDSESRANAADLVDGDDVHIHHAAETEFGAVEADINALDPGRGSQDSSGGGESVNCGQASECQIAASCLSSADTPTIPDDDAERAAVSEDGNVSGARIRSGSGGGWHTSINSVADLEAAAVREGVMGAAEDAHRVGRERARERERKRKREEDDALVAAAEATRAGAREDGGEGGEMQDLQDDSPVTAAENTGEVENGAEAEHKGAITDKGLMDRYLRFMGRVVGLALLSGDPLGVNLDSAFFNSLLSREPLRIILLGPPNCGKTLQARCIYSVVLAVAPSFLLRAHSLLCTDSISCTLNCLRFVHVE